MTAQLWDNDDLRPEVQCSGTLPVLYINVFNDEDRLNPDNDILSRNLPHKEFFYGNYWVETNGCKWLEELGAQDIGSRSEPLPLQIKARGNFTRKAYSKKPYKLKLDTKQKMLGLSKSKHFVLLAHADDYLSYLRNFSGLNLGERIGLPWTPRQQPVEVYINNDYRGLYFLTESIRIDSERINIEELYDCETDSTLITGGYVVEITNRWENNQIRMKEKSSVDSNMNRWLCISPSAPEIYSEEQEEFVFDQFTNMNNAVGECSDDLWNYLDIEDAARYYIVMELINHLEAYSGSTYLFRPRGIEEKWHFSPIWDCGQAFYPVTNNYFFHIGSFSNHWIESMLLNNRFRDKIKEIWFGFMPAGFDGFYSDAQTYVNNIAEAAKSDAQRWENVPAPDESIFLIANNSNIMKGYDTVIQTLKNKIEWMNEIYGAYRSVESPYAISRDSFIYDLQGRRIIRPVSGKIYIRNGKLFRIGN